MSEKMLQGFRIHGGGRGSDPFEMCHVFKKRATL